MQFEMDSQKATIILKGLAALNAMNGTTLNDSAAIIAIVNEINQLINLEQKKE